MRKSRLFLLIVIQAVLLPKSVYAFISPAVISLIASAFGPTIWQFIVLIVSSIITLLSKAKRRYKIILICTFIILGSLILGYGYGRFKVIEYQNTYVPGKLSLSAYDCEEIGKDIFKDLYSKKLSDELTYDSYNTKIYISQDQCTKLHYVSRVIPHKEFKTIYFDEFLKLYNSGKSIKYIDTRGPSKISYITINNALQMDITRINGTLLRLNNFSYDDHIVLFCDHGVRSYAIGQYLKILGYKNIYFYNMNKDKKVMSMFDLGIFSYSYNGTQLFVEPLVKLNLKDKIFDLRKNNITLLANQPASILDVEKKYDYHNIILFEGTYLLSNEDSDYLRNYNKNGYSFVCRGEFECLLCQIQALKLREMGIKVYNVLYVT